MAANPLPRHDQIPTAIVNAVTAIDVPLLVNQGIEWQNNSASDIKISMQAFNCPITEYDFTVPKMQNGVLGTHANAVKSNALPGTYAFTRGATEGNGKIIIRSDDGDHKEPHSRSDHGDHKEPRH